MPKQSLCGAGNATGGTCRRRVPKAGEQCSIHARRPLSAKSILKLGLQSASAVSAMTDVWDLFNKLYPYVEPYVDPVRGLLMPEYFWEAFYAKDKNRMKLELAKANEKMAALEDRYKHLRAKDKLAIEDAYVAILKVADQEPARASFGDDLIRRQPGGLKPKRTLGFTQRTGGRRPSRRRRNRIWAE